MEAGFNIGGRGYPDISFASANFMVVVGGTFYEFSGTSASSPSIAALISLVNAQRNRVGLGFLGYVNEAIWRDSTTFANDVSIGNNSCTGSCLQCCSQGFQTAIGWDPVTGVGSIKFPEFFSALSTPSPISTGRTQNVTNEWNESSGASPANPNLDFIWVIPLVIFGAILLFSFTCKLCVKHKQNDIDTNVPFREVPMLAIATTDE